MRAIALTLVRLLLVASPAGACIDTLTDLVPCIAVFHNEFPDVGGTLEVTPEGPIFWTGNDGVSGPAFFDAGSCTYVLPDGSHLHCTTDNTWERPDYQIPRPKGFFDHICF